MPCHTRFGLAHHTNHYHPAYTQALKGHAPRDEADVFVPTSFVRRDGLYTSVFSAEELARLGAAAGLELADALYGCVHMANRKSGAEWNRVMLTATLAKPAPAPSASE